MQQTSLAAFESLVRDETLSRRQEVCWLALANDGPANNRVLSARTRLPINCVTPRVLELRERGLLRERCRERDPVTGRLAIVWEPLV